MASCILLLSSEMLLSLLGGICSNKGGSTEIGLGIVAGMLGFLCAVVRRRRRSARVKLAADKAGVHSCPKESGQDRAFWRGGEGGIPNFVISLS